MVAKKSQFPRVQGVTYYHAHISGMDVTFGPKLSVDTTTINTKRLRPFLSQSDNVTKMSHFHLSRDVTGVTFGILVSILLRVIPVIKAQL